MNKANLEFLIAQAQIPRPSSDKLAAAVAGSIEVGVVVPSLLRAKLAAAGLDVISDTASLAEYGFASLEVLKRVVVRDKAGALIAMGAAGDHDEALLAAALGYFRENAVGDGPVPAGIMEAPSSPEPAAGPN